MTTKNNDRARVWRVALVAVLLMSPLLVIVNQASAQAPIAGTLATLVNNYRVANGLQPLIVDATFTANTQPYAVTLQGLNPTQGGLCTAQNLPHDSNANIAASAPAGNTASGENLGTACNVPVDFPSHAQVIFDGWRNSPGHNANMLNPGWTHLASAAVQYDNTTMAVQRFATAPGGAAATATPTGGAAATATPTGGAAATATPTGGAAATATPTAGGAATATPTATPAAGTPGYPSTPAFAPVTGTAVLGVGTVNGVVNGPCPCTVLMTIGNNVVSTTVPTSGGSFTLNIPAGASGVASITVNGVVIGTVNVAAAAVAATPAPVVATPVPVSGSTFGFLTGIPTQPARGVAVPPGSVPALAATGPSVAIQLAVIATALLAAGALVMNSRRNFFTSAG